jgi:hypothetical protein
MNGPARYRVLAATVTLSAFGAGTTCGTGMASCNAVAGDALTNAIATMPAAERREQLNRVIQATYTM